MHIVAVITTTQVGIVGAIGLVISTAIPAWLARGGKMSEIQQESAIHRRRDDVRFREVFTSGVDAHGNPLRDPWPHMDEEAD